MSEKVFSRCGMRCDQCLIYRPNVEKEDRRAEVCPVFEQMAPGFHADPETIICDGCSCTDENAVLLDPSVSSYNNAVAMINEMCERQKEILPPMHW